MVVDNVRTCNEQDLKQCSQIDFAPARPRAFLPWVVVQAKFLWEGVPHFWSVLRGSYQQHGLAASAPVHQMWKRLKALRVVCRLLAIEGEDLYRYSSFCLIGRFWQDWRWKSRWEEGVYRRKRNPLPFVLPGRNGLHFSFSLFKARYLRQKQKLKWRAQPGNGHWGRQACKSLCSLTSGQERN